MSLVLAGPVDQSVPTIGTHDTVGFELIDGTVTSRAYFRDAGILQRGIRVGRAFGDAVDQLRANAPTPTPLPATVNLARRYDLVHATRVTIKTRTSFRQNVDGKRDIAAALDDDRPAIAGTPSLLTEVIVIFEFPDHFVSLSFDPASNTLLVVAPQDEGIGIHPSAAFAAALAAANR